MATRSRTSFQKRQKEILRMERQKEKMARRAERKLHKDGGLPEPEDIEASIAAEAALASEAAEAAEASETSATPADALPPGRD